MNINIDNNSLDFNQFFPFYMRVSKELVVEEAGASLLKMIPDIIGKPLGNVFSFKRPWSVKYNYDSILEYKDQMFLMETKLMPLIYRWQIVNLPDSSELLFLGAPWLTSPDYLAQYDLTLNDFALHDSITDMFQVLRAHEIDAKDLKELSLKILIQKELLQKVIDLVPHQIFVKDSNSRFIIGNKAVADFFDISVQDLIGKTDRDFVFLESESEMYLDGDKSVIEGGIKIEFPEEPQTDIHGNIHINHVIKMPFQLENGEKGLMGIAMDITENKIAEKKLKESEYRYRKIVENATDIIYRSDIHGYFTFVNNQAVITTGFSREELLEKHYLDLVRSDYKETLAAYYVSEQFIKSGNKSYFEFPIITKEGNEVWLGQKVQLLFKESKIIGYQAVVRDVTLIKKLEFERKETEDELRETASRLKSLIENLNGGILVEDENRKIISVNQAFCDTFSVPVAPSDMIGWDCTNSAEQSKGLFKDPENFILGIDKILHERKIVTREELYLVNGKILERDYIPIYVKSDYRGHLWYYKDVTDQYENKFQINEQKKFYESILNKIPADVVVWDENHKYLFVNPQAIKSSEIRTWIIGKDDFEYCAYRNRPIEYAHNRRSKFLTIKNEKVEIEWEEKQPTSQGKEVFTLRKMTPIFDENGGFEMCIGYGINITDRKQMEVEIEKARNLAEESLKAKEQFLSTMSHEIRTPMNAIIGLTQLLLNENPRPEQMEYLNGISYSSSNLLNMINDILDFSKIESGKITFEKIHFDLKDFIKKLRNVYRFQAEDKGLIFESIIESDVEKHLIGDTVRLNQILTNLVGNAIKFTSEGKILIKISKISSSANKATLRFEILDSGIGIPKNKIDKIFERFTQAHSDTTRKYGGTGLGLTITKHLVEQQGGKIWLKSKPKKGTSFFVELEFEYGDKKQIVKETITQLGKYGKLDGFKILLVEDNKLNQIVATNFMEKWGIGVTLAENGKMGVELCNAGQFDLVLMDLQMPIMDGYDATRLIRKGNKTIPILALTASASSDVKAKVVKAGMNDYMSKPFETSIFYDKLSKYLNLNKDVKVDTNQVSNEPEIQSNDVAFSLDYYQQFSGGNKEFVREMIKVFIEDTPEIVGKMGVEIENRNHKNMAALAHKLKSSLLLMGMDASNCIRIDEIGKKELNKWDEVKVCFAKIQFEVSQVVAKLGAL